MPAPDLGIDDEDFALDILPAIQKSFGISFEEVDLSEVKTFGQLCAAVQARLPRQSASDCTTQQAFYKLRQAIQIHAQARDDIRPDTRLASILPIGRKRRKAVTAIEQELGMQLAVLEMPPVVQGLGFLLLAASCVGLFFDVAYGLAGIALAIIGLRIAARLTTRLGLATMRDVAERMSSRYYRASRRDPETVNHREVVGRLQFLLTQDFGLEQQQMTADATL